MTERYQHVRFFRESDLAERLPRLLPSCNNSRHFTYACRQTEAIEPEAADYLAFLLRCAGVDPCHYRGDPLSRRLHACLRSLKSRSIAEARARLEQDPQQITMAVSAILIGVTEFFRDPEVFAYLDEVVLPKLARDHQPLRIWSAGCADGAELYSVGMLLAQRGLLGRRVLLGTDCRSDAVSKAKRGWFDRAQVDRIAPSLRETFFVPEEKGWIVCRALRKAIEWAQGDILADPPADAPCWDLILCRNVAIYLEPAASALLWSRLLQTLRVGGVLVVGTAERPETQGSLVRLAPCVFQKRE